MNSRSRNLGLVVQGIHSAQQSLSALINRIVEPMGLNMSRLTVLTLFSNRPNQSQTVSSIVAAANMNQPTVTKIISYLIEQAWLTTELDPTDARKRLLNITPAGLGTVIRAYTELSPAIDRACLPLNDEQIGQLNHLLSKLNNR